MTAYERTKKIALEICELVGAGAIAYALIWIFVHYTVGIR